MHLKLRRKGVERLPVLEERGLEAASPCALNSGLIRIPAFIRAGALKRRERRGPPPFNCMVTAKMGLQNAQIAKNQWLRPPAPRAAWEGILVPAGRADARPHPGPLPRGEGESSADVKSSKGSHGFRGSMCEHFGESSAVLRACRRAHRLSPAHRAAGLKQLKILL